MQIGVLGSLVICGDISRESVSSRKLKVILGTLSICAGNPISSDQLAEELWGNRPLGNTRNALQAGVLRLRKLIEMCSSLRGGDVVQTVAGGYRLDLPAGGVDAQRFRELAARGSRELPTRPEFAVELLQEALGLWRGPALFDIDGPRCRTEAAALEEVRLRAQEDLISGKLTLGAQRDVVPELRQLTIAHPDRERFCEQLMIALYREGRQSEALRIFLQTRKRLVSELGVEPSPPLRELYQKILSHDSLAG